MPLPDFRWNITTKDGETYLLPQRDVQRVLDRRGSFGPPQVVYEVKLPSGVIRRLWPDEIANIDQEAA